MPVKNKRYFNELAKVANRPVVMAKIDRLVDNPNTHIKAFATVNLGGAFVVHDVKVIDGQKGLFVQMPQTSFKKNGQISYQDLFHAVTADARNELVGKVLDAFRQKLTEEAGTLSHQGDYPILDGIDADDPFDGLPEMSM
jgi:stage V sporulation protein G